MERYIVMRILVGLFLLFVVIFFIIRLASGGNDDPVTPEEPAETAFVLSEQVDNFSSVDYTIIGRINSAEEHRQVHFSIDKNRRVVELKEGYDGTVIDSINLQNSINSYEKLLFALEAEGFTSAKEEVKFSDPGLCSSGRKYFFKSKVSGATKTDLWTTSCSSRHGTAAGDRNDIRRLFEDQFPGYDDMMSGVRL